jgi:hypothetical protein
LNVTVCPVAIEKLLQIRPKPSSSLNRRQAEVEVKVILGALACQADRRM